MSRPRLSDIASTPADVVTPAAAPQSPAGDILSSRHNVLSKIARGKVDGHAPEFVDPDRCRPWPRHNRDVANLNAENCADLIAAFHAGKRQHTPATVRRISGDPNYDYEIIAGVRRWWTVRWLRANHFPNFEYLVSVRNMGDEEAFLVSDLENRARRDITDWERANDYLGALTLYYGGRQDEMAKCLEVSPSWLSRLLDVARLPPEVVAAYPSPHDITIAVGRDLKPLLREYDVARRVIAEAARISAMPAENRPAGAADVTKALLRAAMKTKPATSSKPVALHNASGQTIFRYRMRGKVLDLQIPTKNVIADSNEIQEAIRELLREISSQG